MQFLKTNMYPLTVMFLPARAHRDPRGILDLNFVLHGLALSFDNAVTLFLLYKFAFAVHIRALTFFSCAELISSAFTLVSRFLVFSRKFRDERAGTKIQLFETNFNILRQNFEINEFKILSELVNRIHNRAPIQECLRESVLIERVAACNSNALTSVLGRYRRKPKIESDFVSL